MPITSLSPYHLALGLLPTALMILWFLGNALGWLNNTIVAPGLGAAMVLMELIYPFLLGWGRGKKEPWPIRAALGFCCLAPLALLQTWVLVPSPAGMGLGGAGFFLEWLHKYPSAWGVNIKVMLGFVCIIGSSLLPAIFGLCWLWWWMGQKTRATYQAGISALLIVLNLLLIGPVFWWLDLDMWLLGLSYGPWQIIYGPLLRSLGLLGMLLLFGLSTWPRSR